MTQRNFLTGYILIAFIVIIFTTVFQVFFVSKRNISRAEIETVRVESVSAYDTFLADLNQILLNESPREALEYLSVKMELDITIANSCHTIAHSIGHKSYEKYGTFEKAISYQDDICGSGYLHGVIESYFASQSDVELTMKTVCAAGDGRCLHGIGHGIMYATSNDLPQSLALCNSFETNFQQIYCAEGVFMENFTTDHSKHQSNFLNPTNVFYPCNEQTGLYMAACYYYAPTYYLSLHPGKYSEILGVCGTLVSSAWSACSRGAGSRIMKYNIMNANEAENYCMGAAQDQHSDCLVGMVQYHILHYNSKERSFDLCNRFRPENQALCKQTVTKSNLFADR